MSTVPPQTPTLATPLGELGTSGLRIYSGWVQEDFDPKIRGRRAMEIYREMRDNSAIIGASLHAIDVTMRQVEWYVEPASSSTEDRQRAEFVDQCRGDMSFSWADTILEQISMLQYGFALCELVYKRRQGYQDSGAASSHYDDGLVGWAKIPLRAQETIWQWETDPNGGIQGCWQLAPPDYVRRYIPIRKALLFRPSRVKNNPEGRSLLRSSYWPYYAGKKLTEIMLIGVERDIAGLPVVRVPGRLMNPSAAPEEKQTLDAYKDIAINVRRGEQEGVVLPSDRWEGGQSYHYDLQLLASAGKREFNVAELVRDMTRLAALPLLTDLLLMGHEKVGSYALAETKGGLYETSLDGYLQALEDPYNHFAIPRLMLLNGWPPQPGPKLKHKPLNPENLAALADMLQKLVASKILTPDPELEESIRQRAELPPRPDDVVPASTKPEPAPQPPVPPAAAPPAPPEDPDDEDEEAEPQPSRAPADDEDEEE